MKYKEYFKAEQKSSFCCKLFKLYILNSNYKKIKNFTIKRKIDDILIKIALCFHGYKFWDGYLDFLIHLKTSLSVLVLLVFILLS